MEVVCIDKQTFDELLSHFCTLKGKVTRLCHLVEDLGLKKWLDTQDVYEILGVFKKTLQVYRDKGLLPFSLIKHKIFSKFEDVRDFTESNYNPLRRRL